MREIIEVDPDGEEKCPMCRFGFSTLYRFENEEDPAICGDCFLETILEEGIDIATEDELIVHQIVAELVDHALAELSAGELDGLEDTLHSIDDHLPDNNPATAPANA